MDWSRGAGGVVKALGLKAAPRSAPAPPADGTPAAGLALTRDTCIPQGIVYGKPVNQGITQLKAKRNLKNVAEERAGRRCGNLRLLNSYWINEVGCQPATGGAATRTRPGLHHSSRVVARSLTPNSFPQDSTYKYFEVVFVDPAHNTIRNVRVPPPAWSCWPFVGVR